jgi:hypothetical protein
MESFTAPVPWETRKVSSRLLPPALSQAGNLATVGLWVSRKKVVSRRKSLGSERELLEVVFGGDGGALQRSILLPEAEARDLGASEEGA